MPFRNQVLGRILAGLALLATLLMSVSAPVSTAQDHPQSQVAPQNTDLQRGVLVIAHGGGKDWNDPVRQVVRLASERIPYPVELGFQMMHEDQSVERAVIRLEEAGVNEIVVVPLLISSSGTMFEEIKHLMGLPNRYPMNLQEGHSSISVKARVLLASPVNDNPFIAEVLASMAQEISQTPAEETIILIAHGPNDDADAMVWERNLNTLGSLVEKHLGLKGHAVGIWRQDLPSQGERLAFQQRIRAAIQNIAQDSRPLIVPLLVGGSSYAKRSYPEWLGDLTGSDGAGNYVPKGLVDYPDLLAEWIVDSGMKVRVLVPEVVGRTAEEATLAIEGFGLRTIVTEVSWPVADGQRVIAQYPAPSQLLEPGSYVNIAVARSQQLVSETNYGGSKLQYEYR